MECKELHKKIIDECVYKAHKRGEETNYKYRDYYCYYTCPKCKQLAEVKLEINFRVDVEVLKDGK